MTSTHAIDRWLYRGGHPSGPARVVNALWGGLAAAGIGPARLARLEVVGRRTGRTIALPVVVTRCGGQRYLVAMLGERSAWVANVRAAGGAAVLRRGTPEAVHLTELPPERRAPVLRRYLQDAPGARAHVPVDHRAPVGEFARVADRYPVFRIDAAHT